MALPSRKTAHLRWGRVSSAGANYFVTACTQHRLPELLREQTVSAIRAVVSEMNSGQDLELVAATTMPDHVHLLFALGGRLKLGQVVGKFKSLVRARAPAGWRWQEDGFEHRLRANEAIEDYGFYIFMNPYRAGLIGLGERWPAWICPTPSRLEFLGLLGDGEPIPAGWVHKSVQMRARLSVSR